VNRFVRAFVIVFAAVYFVADAIFATIAHPLARWLGEHEILLRLRAWIRSLRPYPALVLFAVPLILLEPVKPVAAYLTATGHLKAGLTVLVIGEILKLVLVERLFSINRDKLLTIPAFAWAYGKYWLVRKWFEATEAWQMVRRLSRMVRLAIRRGLAELKPSRASIAR
jgi:hypothetical protein